MYLHLCTQPSSHPKIWGYLIWPNLLHRLSYAWTSHCVYCYALWKQKLFCVEDSSLDRVSNVARSYLLDFYCQGYFYSSWLPKVTVQQNWSRTQYFSLVYIASIGFLCLIWELSWRQFVLVMIAHWRISTLYSIFSYYSWVSLSYPSHSVLHLFKLVKRC